MLIGGSASFVRTRNGGGGNSVTSLGMHPNVLYLVADRVALGGQLGVSYMSSDGGDGSSWLIGPAARLFFGSSASKTLTYLGASLLTGSASTSSSLGGDSDASVWGGEGLIGVALMLSRQVGITGEAFVRREEDTFKGSQVQEVRTAGTEFGLRFGVAAFLY